MSGAPDSIPHLNGRSTPLAARRRTWALFRNVFGTPLSRSKGRPRSYAQSLSDLSPGKPLSAKSGNPFCIDLAPRPSASGREWNRDRRHVSFRNRFNSLGPYSASPATASIDAFAGQVLVGNCPALGFAVMLCSPSTPARAEAFACKLFNSLWRR